MHYAPSNASAEHPVRAIMSVLQPDGFTNRRYSHMDETGFIKIGEQMTPLHAQNCFFFYASKARDRNYCNEATIGKQIDYLQNYYGFFFVTHL